ncbi:PREDICTED: uncharacterized protein LOC107344745 [Acropora digitifera]|uniref:uncharacterized protein LOC107344745 n=1 Tax=Acropora digitifera TaxID=70779 RepID=UPI00077AC01A|nr:PREDICTED: uncharacterized protein LOC107344745 [Acropora digitifera]
MLDNLNSLTPTLEKIQYLLIYVQGDVEDWILEQYPNYTSTIFGIIGWVDLTDPECNNFNERIKARSNERFNNLFLAAVVLGYLEDRGLTYDLLIRTRHFKLAETVVKKFPKLKFVIDHAAKPEIAEGKIDEWKRGMEMLAQNPNVYCKISGLVTEASRENWKVDDLIPYVKVSSNLCLVTVLSNFYFCRVIDCICLIVKNCLVK